MINNLARRYYHSRVVTGLIPTLVSALKRELKDCKSVLDLGCGPSSPLQHCGSVEYSVGVEAFKKYLTQSEKQKIHTKYINKQITEVDFPDGSFDAVILIEVIEHLPRKQVRVMLKKAERWARKKVIVSSPNGFVLQQEVDNNPWQKHISGWDTKDMKKLGFKSRGLAGLKALRQGVQSTTMGDDLISSMRFRPRGLWFVITSLSQMVTYHVPQLAFELFNVKKIEREDF